MHQLFVEVLAKRDLSRAGDLFSIDDKSIVGDLSELIHHIQKISSASNFLDKHNDQSVVEICLTRITSAIRYDLSLVRNNCLKQYIPLLVTPELLKNTREHWWVFSNRVFFMI